VIPYVAGLLVAYLEGVEEVAGIVGTRVATKTPRKLEEPWLRVQLLDEAQAPRSSADHLVTAYAQIDCYAGKKGDEVLAATLARTVREAIVAMPDAAHEDATVSSTRVGSRPLPDTDLDETVDRHIVTATIVAHSL
jgi:hypothetical protein